MLVSDLIRRELTQLGDSPQQVANHLSAQRILGVRDSPESCPIANYLKALQGIGDKIYGVTQREVVLTYQENTADYVLLTEATKAFVENFDDGLYPDLEREANVYVG